MSGTIWPTAAASRTRFQCVGDGATDSQHFCRLFYNESNNTIELVPVNDNYDTSQRQVYDDLDTGIEDEPYYRSYLDTVKETDVQVFDSFHLDDVIGATLSLDCNVQNPTESNANIIVYAYPKINGGRCACHKKYAIDSQGCEDLSDVRKLIDAIRMLASLQPNFSPDNNPIRYLVILNPFSGGRGVNSKKGARHIYETMLKPMLEETGVEHDVLMTNAGGHARQRCLARETSTSSNPGETQCDKEECSTSTDTEARDISEYKAIIAMGGDGILFEIMQGIHDRSDEKEILKKMKFGIVGCGTCNGLAKSILHWSGENYGPLESIFLICKGKTAPSNLSSYQLANSNKTYTSFLTFSWGLIADVDLESECIRWLGALRTDVWAVYRGLLFQKKYRARFSYLPPNSSGESKFNGAADIPEFGKQLPEEWVTIEDDLMIFWASNVSHPSFNVLLCPMAKMNDGLFHIIIVRASCSRFRLAELLLKLESGNHIQCKDVEVIDCVAYRLDPLSDNSYNDIDGELVEQGPIQAHMMPDGVQFFSGKSTAEKKL